MTLMFQHPAPSYLGGLFVGEPSVTTKTCDSFRWEGTVLVLVRGGRDAEFISSPPPFEVARDERDVYWGSCTYRDSAERFIYGRSTYKEGV